MLARLQKSMKEKDQGFTLIELLVVIVIIGILAAIAIPLFLNQRKKGIDASLKSDLKNAATTIETYIVDNPSTTAYTGTASAGGAGNGVLTGFDASEGNTVVSSTITGGYCIEAYNAAASSAVSDSVSMVYKSNAGGLQSGTGSC